MPFRDPISRSKRSGRAGRDAIVEGSVLRAGDRVRIRRSSSRPRRPPPRAKSYEREVKTFGLQSEVARDIASEIQLRSRRRAGRMMMPSGVNPEAYELYLRGDTNGARSVRKGGASIGYYEKALALDPAIPVPSGSPMRTPSDPGHRLVAQKEGWPR